MTCYIGVGSNLGNRRAYIRKAIALLRSSPGVRVEKMSPIYETAPQGGPRGQRNFLNLVVKADCALSPDDLLRLLKRIEAQAGRRRRQARWAAREIDLDILLCGRAIVRKRRLRIPHPRMRERYFVLKPLVDIAPRLRDPETGERVADILRSLGVKGKS